MAENNYRALLRVVVAQITRNIGFNSASLSCIDVLQDLLAHHLENLCNSAHQYTEHGDLDDSGFL